MQMKIKKKMARLMAHGYVNSSNQSLDAQCVHWSLTWMWYNSKRPCQALLLYSEVSTFAWNILLLVCKHVYIYLSFPTYIGRGETGTSVTYWLYSNTTIAQYMWFLLIHFWQGTSVNCKAFQVMRTVFKAVIKLTAHSQFAHCGKNMKHLQFNKFRGVIFFQHLATFSHI